MRIIKIPSGEYYVLKGSNKSTGDAFVFKAHKHGNNTGSFNMSSHIEVPAELMNKKLMLKIIIVE